MSSNKHGEYRRPEITRTNDMLAQDQRKIIERQQRQLEFLEENSRNELFGLINSKIYANIENNVDFCFNYCKNKKVEGGGLNTPFGRFNNTEEKASDSVNLECFDNCVVKKGESYKMLLIVNLLLDYFYFKF